MIRLKNLLILISIIVLLALAILAFEKQGNVDAQTNTSTLPTNLKVAFIGDQSTNSNAYAVLRLIKAEGAELTVINGDLGYNDTAQSWENMINATLGPNYPLVVTIGDHDRENWSTYTLLLASRDSRNTDLKCDGKVGVASNCYYKGLHFIVSGIGTDYTTGRSFIEKSVAASTHTWKICAWHRPNILMQVGITTESKVSLSTYDVCREKGAMIATADAHLYARTYTMSSFQNKTVANTQKSELTLSPGLSFAVITGLGGESRKAEDPNLVKNPWWAFDYTRTDNAKYGALFCTFNLTIADCYFKGIDGLEKDRFRIVNKP